MTPRVLTDHPIAFHSPDHIDAEHGGSGNDNSINPNFNRKLSQIFGERRLSVMDMGCAGGGFVKSLLDDGHFAIGLEGSDFCKKHNKFEWKTIPANLFTCDLTKPFQVNDLDEEHCEECSPVKMKFDLITAWEVMEHFTEEELPQVIQNVLSHLKEDGIWLMSVSWQVDRHFHRCCHHRDWWIPFFAGYGLVDQQNVRAIIEPDYVRGPNPTPWAITAADSFHLALKRAH